MNGTDRFDQQIRAALEWEADRTASRQPSFDRAMAALATRVGDSRGTDMVRRIEGAPASHRAISLLVAGLLLVALLALIAAGSRPESPPSDLNPGLFGLAQPCSAVLADGVAHEFTLPDELRRIRFLDDGSVLHVRSPDAEHLAHPGPESTFTRRQLSASGRARVQAVVDELRLTPGCRVHASAPVVFTTRLAGGFGRFQTGGWPGAYPGYDLLRWMTLEEDQIASDALESLTSNIDELVGPGGWADGIRRPVEATAWLSEPILPEASPPELPAGDLRGLDACELLLAATVGANQALAGDSPLRFAYASPACEYLAAGNRVALLSVRGQSTTFEDAERIVDGLFGGDATRGLERRRLNPCWLDRRVGCPYAVAGWVDGRLAVLVYPPASIDGRPGVTLADGAAAMTEVLAGLSR